MTEPVTNFESIRMWDGSQHRAFEELAYQLLRLNVPKDAKAVRTGNPDGGVEWYAPLPDGTEWGWQAKFYKDFDQLLGAMTKSVRRVSVERPQLTKLTFVIHSNLATGTTGGQRKSRRQRYEDLAENWLENIYGGRPIEFELVQGSDLLDELAKPEHVGRRWFWWGDTVFGHDWLEKKHAEQANAAGQKYRPDLQVDLPIQEHLLALGFDSTVMDQFDAKRRQILSSIDRLSLRPQAGPASEAKYKAIVQTANALKKCTSTLTVEVEPLANGIKEFFALCDKCYAAIEVAREEERDLESARRQSTTAQSDRRKIFHNQAHGTSVHDLASSLQELPDTLQYTIDQSWQRNCLFLTGSAGSGKTHLFLDAVRRALDNGRGAIFVSAARFGPGDPWASIAAQIGLPDIGSDTLLSAMDAAGAASSITGSRFVIYIDALNETPTPSFWFQHLPAIRAKIKQYSHLALAISCRDTYEDIVIEPAEKSHYVKLTHRGFADREVEAIQRYFSHYRLELPRFPLLMPAFTQPLFLRMYCEAADADRDNAEDLGHAGRIAIFKQYLAVKISNVARHFRANSNSVYELNRTRQIVESAFNAIIDELSRSGLESITADVIEAVVRGSGDITALEASRLVGLLQDEGILTRELVLDAHDKPIEGCRIIFQSLSDFLILQRRFSITSDPIHDQALIRWLNQDCSVGILEAAAVLIPEEYGIELPDMLSIKLSTTLQEANPRKPRNSDFRKSHLFGVLVLTLPYRRANAITPRTIHMLNAAQTSINRDEFYRVLFTMAPQRGNLLNGNGLHKYLMRQKMPLRDADFGIATYSELDDEFSSASLLGRWAAAGPYPTYDDEVIELSCIPLCWLLSSPNRFMRDWVTKSLVQVLHGHLAVMRALVERFWNVDDPYVVQRIVAIAYGALLRSPESQRQDAGALAQVICDLVFTPPVRADELLLDAARGIVRFAEANALLSSEAAAVARRPYGLKPPRPAWLESTIDAKYAPRAEVEGAKSYSSIYMSVIGLGDFRRYVIEPGMRPFSKYRVGETYPSVQPPEARLVKRHWKAFIASLTIDQAAHVSQHEGDPWALRRALSLSTRFESRPDLSESQKDLLRKAVIWPKFGGDGYPKDAARRWVFQRTLSLGWTPKLFGDTDRYLGRGRGRDQHKAERWGKKYQWIAYHELLARVADNFQPIRERFGESDYEGLHQDIGGRELDPTLPPIPFREFIDHEGMDHDGKKTTAWQLPPVQLQVWPPIPVGLHRYEGNIKAFIADKTTEPTPDKTLIVKDTNGDDWVVLQEEWTEVDSADPKEWRGMQQNVVIESILVKSQDTSLVRKWLRTKSRRAIRDLFDSNRHADCCYLYEVGQIGPACPSRKDKISAVDVGGKSCQIITTCEEYLWEGSILDCSIGESVQVVLPSTFIQEALTLRIDASGPSWVNSAGVTVLTTYWTSKQNGSALIIRASVLKQFLADHGLDLVADIWFQRVNVKGSINENDEYYEHTIHATLSQNLSIH